MLLDKEAVRAAADVAVVAEEIGIDIEYRGKEKLILCPCHNDRHFGSCFLTDYGFRCYSCNHRGDIFDLVSHYKNVSFHDAVRIVANICGGEEQFMLSDDGTSTGVTDTRFISKQEQRLIGIMDAPVWVTVDFVEDKDDADENTGALEPTYDTNERLLGYQVKERSLISPLYDLFLNNRTVYRELIDNFCETSIRHLQLQKELFRRQTISDPQLSMIVEMVRSAGLEGAMDTLLGDKIYKIQRISLIHGNGTVVTTAAPNREKKAAPLNSALISTIQNSIWKKEGAPF